jgi:hypothetical protein
MAFSQPSSRGIVVQLLHSIKKGALSSSEDESAPCIGNIPGAKNATLLFGNPAILLGQDPWLCVAKLLWLCPFGDILKLSSNR